MSNYPSTLPITLKVIERDADAQHVAELTQLARSIDRKRALLKVIGKRAMKCTSCAGKHLLIAEDTHIMVLHPCAGMMQGERNE